MGSLRFKTLGMTCGNGAAGFLIGGHVLQPFGVEGRDIGVEAGGAGEDLGIAGPAQALIALRAVGRDVHEIAFLAPLNVVLQLIDHRIGALEGSRRA